MHFVQLVSVALDVVAHPPDLLIGQPDLALDFIGLGLKFGPPPGDVLADVPGLFGLGFQPLDVGVPLPPELFESLPLVHGILEPHPEALQFGAFLLNQRPQLGSCLLCLPALFQHGLAGLGLG